MTTDPPADPPKRKRPAGPGRGHKVKVGPWAGSGVPAGGNGWGGRAKGKGAPPQALIENHSSKLTPAERRAKIADKQAAADELLAELYTIGMNEGEPGGVRVMAINGALDRIEGKPVQRTVSGTVDTVEEIRTRDPVEASKTYQRLIGGK